MTDDDATRPSSSEPGCVDGMCEIPQQQPDDTDPLDTAARSGRDSPGSGPVLRPWPDAERGTPASGEE